MSTKKRIVIGVIAAVCIAYLLTGVTTVQPGERAVVRRFGRVLPDKPRPGLYVGLPWGIDSVQLVPVDRVRIITIGYRPEVGGAATEGQFLTGDHNLINIQMVLNYSINEDEVEDYVVQADRVESLLERAAEAALAEWVAGRSVDEVIFNGKKELPGFVVLRAGEGIRTFRLGIQVDQASVGDLYPPEEVRPQFEMVTQAQTAIRTKRYKAEQDAEQIVRAARIKRFQSGQAAEAFAREQHLSAEADAVRFERRRQEYHGLRRGNPAFLAGIWWDTMGVIFKRYRDTGRLDLLDHHIGQDGIDIMQFPPQPRKK